MPINIPVIGSQNPLVKPAVDEKTYNTWFLTDFNLSATLDRSFNAKVTWQLGKLNEDGTSELSEKTGFCLLQDILSEQSLTENPEIAAIVEGFLGALAAVSLRKGAID